ncbi:MAG: ABC transporter ATP-binding protein [Chloroflexota bacterium]
MSISLSLLDVSKSYNQKPVLRSISFHVQENEILALLGPSGCGKSTTLAIIAGLENPDHGDVLWKGESLKGIPPYARGFGLMFQDLALFPHLSVFENIAFGLRQQKRKEEEIRRRVTETLELVNLPGLERRDVSTLSGGEQQRVALARSLAPRPRLMMLDEPLASLDRTLKDRLVVELREILTRTTQTTIYVTHDQQEAFMIADQIVVMNAGRIEQIGAPQEVYAHPATPFVASFLGMNNLFEGEVITKEGGNWLILPIGSVRVPTPHSGKVTALIRPQAAVWGAANGLVLQGKVIKKMFGGENCRVEMEIRDRRMSFLFPACGNLPAEQETVTLTILPQAIQVFPNAEEA